MPDQKPQPEASCAGTIIGMVISLAVFLAVSPKGCDKDKGQKDREAKQLEEKRLEERRRSEAAWLEKTQHFERAMGLLVPNESAEYARLHGECKELLDTVRGGGRTDLMERIRKAQQEWGRRAAEPFKKAVQNVAPLDRDALNLLRTQFRVLISHFPDLAEKVQADWVERSSGELVKRMQKVAAGDRAGYQKARRDCQQFAKEHPSAETKLETSANDWGQRTLADFGDRLRRIKPGDWKQFRPFREEHRQLVEVRGDLQAPLLQAEWTWIGPLFTQLTGEAERNVQNDPIAALRQLQRSLDELKQEGFDLSADVATSIRIKVRTGTRQVIHEGLELVRKQVAEHRRKERYQKALKVTEAFVMLAETMATETGQAVELKAFKQACEFLAAFAQRAGKTDPP